MKTSPDKNEALIKRFKRQILLLSHYYNHSLTDMQLQMYADVLSDYPVDEFERRANAYMKDPVNRFFPTPPVQLMAGYKHTDALVTAQEFATALASKIYSAILRIGYTDINAAQSHFGDDWDIIHALGGWAELSRCLPKHNSFEEKSLAKRIERIVAAAQQQHPVLSAENNVIQLVSNLANQKTLGGKK